MGNNFFANIYLTNTGRDKQWTVEAGINEDILLKEDLPEEYIALAILRKQNKDLEIDSFVKLGNASEDAYTRFIQNPLASKVVDKELEQKQNISPELRIFSSIAKAKAADNVMFNLDKRIKLITSRANIERQKVMEQFGRVINKLAKYYKF